MKKTLAWTGCLGLLVALTLPALAKRPPAKFLTETRSSADAMDIALGYIQQTKARVFFIRGILS